MATSEPKFRMPWRRRVSWWLVGAAATSGLFLLLYLPEVNPMHDNPAPSIGFTVTWAVAFALIGAIEAEGVVSFYEKLERAKRGDNG